MHENSHSYLSSIKKPSDVNRFSNLELERLAEDIRSVIIDVVSKNGGHLASNLGVVELTIALHRVFFSPKDKIIWDVGHQCYTHKLLTGRYAKFRSLRERDGISGFPKRAESIHDVVDTGHSSTSLSTGIGILLGQELQNIDGKVIAVIGDGALTAGIAFEALNSIGHLQKNLIIVLNDNNMSISPNVGALSLYLSRITATHFYQDIRKRIDTTVKEIPYFGGKLYELVVRLKKGIKAVFFKENLFSDLGFEYVGPIDGHNIPLLLRIFRNVKKLRKPIVVHTVTRKGKGYVHAEGDPTLYHGVSPFSIVDGKLEKKSKLSYTEVFSDSITEYAAVDNRIVAITAAMTKGTGLSPFAVRFPRRFFDVGITEQHAVTFAAGLALSGMKPVVAMYSTFSQRAVDQIIHDVALQGLPVIIALDRAGLVGSDGATHQGLFDIALFRSIPGLTILAPSSEQEMRNCLSYGLSASSPVILRYPRDWCPSITESDGPIEEGRGVFIREKTEKDVLLIAVGSLLIQTIDAADILDTMGVAADVYNLRFIKPVDEDFFCRCTTGYRVVYCVEEGVEKAGVGEYLQGVLARNRCSVHYTYRGVEDTFIGEAGRDELLEETGLTGKHIAEHVLTILSSSATLRLVKRNENR